MQSRQTLRLLTLLSAAATLWSLGSVQPALAATSGPASVAIESAGIARETGCAVVHVATSEPTQVRLERPPDKSRLIADFLDAVLAPNAATAIHRTPQLREAVTIRQASSKPPVVRLEVVSPAGDTPTVQRFADSRGLLVKVQVDRPVSSSPLTARPASEIGSPGPVTGVRFASTTPPAPLVAPLAAPTTRPGPTTAGPVVARPAGAVLRDLPARIAAAPTPGVRSPLAALPSTLLTGGPGRAPAVALVGEPSESVPSEAEKALPSETPSLRSPGPDLPSDGAELQRIRVVDTAPVRVAIDCSRPMPYRLDELESPRRYVLTFPGAAIGPDCLQAVALHPSQPGFLTVEQGAEGAEVVIPAATGQICTPKPGASPNTILCELTGPAEGALVAQRPGPAGAAGGETATDAGSLLINVDFQDAPVVEILTALAKYADRNIIATTSVTGSMNVHLTRVTLAEALDLIVALNSLEYTLVGDRNYVVGTAEEIARVRGAEGALPIQLVYKPQNTTPYRIAQEMQETAEQVGVTIKIVEDAGSVVFMNLPDEKTGEWLRERAAQVDVPPTDTTRWIQLEYMTAAQAAAALEGLVPNVEVRVPGPEAPQVAVIGLSGKSVDVDKAEQLLTNLDVQPTLAPEAGGAMVTEVLRVTYIEADGLVQLINGMFADEVEAYVATSVLELQEVQESQEAGGLRPSATVVVRGPEAVVAAVKQLHLQVDVPPPQVEITATITDVSVDKDHKVGFEWQLPGLIVSEESTAGDGFKVGKIVRAPLNSGGSGSFTASFEAAVSNSNATILSRTTLVAVNGKSASFLVGEIVPYEIAVAGDGTVSRSVEFQDIGLGLKFGPNVDANGMITLFLAPQVRSFSGFSPQGYPIVATREAQTIVRVSDGDVIAIGGLLRDEELKTLSGIPLLKDIPFFGELFKKRQKQRRKSEVVVFAEVKLLRPETAPMAVGATAVGEG